MSSVTARVFRGCRTLLAPAAASSKSSTAATVKPKTTAATSSKAKGKPNPSPKTASSPASSSSPRTWVRPTGILKVTPVSPALAQFLGASESSRTDAVKKIWTYIKANNLQNPTDKREIFCDEKLKTLFDGKDKISFLEIGKHLSRHFVKTA